MDCRGRIAGSRSLTGHGARIGVARQFGVQPSRCFGCRSVLSGAYRTKGKSGGSSLRATSQAPHVRIVVPEDAAPSSRPGAAPAYAGSAVANPYGPLVSVADQLPSLALPSLTDRAAPRGVQRCRCWPVRLCFPAAVHTSHMNTVVPQLSVFAMRLPSASYG